MTAWLLTWLWQGTALAAGIAILLRCAPRLNAATKYVVWCSSLLTVAWLGWTSSPFALAGLKPCATAVGATADGAQFGTGSAGLQPCPNGTASVLYVPTAPDVLLSIFIGIWAAIALVQLLRLLPGVHAVFALRDRCRAFPSDVEAQLPLWLEAKRGGRNTELMLCDEVAGATVLGLLHPCIAIPPGLVDALTPGELDQVILHEHAHVQRRDDWSRLAQTMLMSALWVHPAALVISRVLNREREMACDEWVVARTGEPKAYARCLAHAAETLGRMRQRSRLVPALVGGRHELVQRVDRLLAMRGTARRRVSLAGATLATCAIAAMSVQLEGVRFAEIADIVFPRVPVPMRSVYNGATAMMVQVVVDPARATVRLKPDTTLQIVAADLEVGITTTVPSVEPPIEVLQARTFQSTFAPPTPSALNAPVAPNRPNRWAAPGVEIASAAKKTSVGVANVFSRAGVSLARSF